MITGMFPMVWRAEGMTKFLCAEYVCIFDRSRVAASLRDPVPKRAAALATEAEVAIEHTAKSRVRKEALVAKVVGQGAENPGFVRVISATEACDIHKP